MRWLFVIQLRPYVLLAAAASLVLNLALLVPSLYMLQVFDRVFSSRSIETLVMLGLFARARAVAWASAWTRARPRCWPAPGARSTSGCRRRRWPTALKDAARRRGRAAPRRLPDIARLRNFLAGPAVQALFDAPWLPIYMLVIFALHPLLGVGGAGLGASCCSPSAWRPERVVRRDAEAGVAPMARRPATTHRCADAQRRSAGRHGHARQRRSADWRAQARHACSRRRQRLSALRRAVWPRWGACCARRCRWRCSASAPGWWWPADASPGIMIAATLLLGRALQPVEHLIAGWKALVEVRGCLARRLQRRAGLDASPGQPTSACAAGGARRARSRSASACSRPTRSGRR